MLGVGPELRLGLGLRLECTLARALVGSAMSNKTYRQSHLNIKPSFSPATENLAAENDRAYLDVVI